ncbi:hypothetical protein GDO86_008452 [Hymenochirus boettgeri]|uniref:Uncharacterized protein n=1 Tax=Hymenochirus boettgeri TaxID=247094 RepID=A0A8T2J237_9PIPI|nr:hypothetical protein GDO86_008452 [Hymenochirus boettgeri]
MTDEANNSNVPKSQQSIPGALQGLMLHFSVAILRDKLYNFIIKRMFVLLAIHISSAKSSTIMKISAKKGIVKDSAVQTNRTIRVLCLC